MKEVFLAAVAVSTNEETCLPCERFQDIRGRSINPYFTNDDNKPFKIPLSFSISSHIIPKLPTSCHKNSQKVSLLPSIANCQGGVSIQISVTFVSFQSNAPCTRPLPNFHLPPLIITLAFPFSRPTNNSLLSLS